MSMAGLSCTISIILIYLNQECVYYCWRRGPIARPKAFTILPEFSIWSETFFGYFDMGYQTFESWPAPFYDTIAPIQIRATQGILEQRLDHQLPSQSRLAHNKICVIKKKPKPLYDTIQASALGELLARLRWHLTKDYLRP